MTIFDTLLEQRLGPSHSAAVTRLDDGRVVLHVSSGGVQLDGLVELEPDCMILDELDEEAVTPLFELGAYWRRLHDYLSRFPAEAQRGDETVTFALSLPASKPLWSSDGLWATVLQTRRSSGKIVDLLEMEVLVLTRAALDAGEWQARLDAFDERRASWPDRLDELGPDDAGLESSGPPAPASDEGWEAYVEEIGLDSEGLGARVAPAIAAAFDRRAAVRARYESLYGLKLPSGLAHLAALIAALGAMPAAPPDPAPWAPEPAPPGDQRGRAWLEAALAMRVAGLSTWFIDGALERRTRDAAAAHDALPPGGEGPLDARLDMRFRRDAPQFIPFLAGDSDGLHWGFWYDSPAHAPVIAHNYARDSAETWLDGEAEMIPFLQHKIARAIEQATSEVEEAADEEARGYPLRQWRALRVVAAHLEEVAARAAERAWDDAPACPWPRTAGNPIGSPTLALRPDSGAVPHHVPGFSNADADLPDEQLAAWIEEARRDLAAGRPAYAHALGLYLHWADRDALRAASGQLLLEAYEALGFRPFAEILKVHLLHRDLPSVAVFEQD